MRTATHFALAAAAAVALTACGSSSGGSSSGAGAASPAATQAASTAAGSAGAGATLKIAGFKYSPSTLTVTAGESVAVTNNDSAEHTATSDMAGLFKSDNINQGDTVTFTAPTKPGTYTFHCQFHPYMHGTLIVT